MNEKMKLITAHANCLMVMVNGSFMHLTLHLNIIPSKSLHVCRCPPHNQIYSVISPSPVFSPKSWTDDPTPPNYCTYFLFFEGSFHCFTLLQLKVSLIQKQQIEKCPGFQNILFRGKASWCFYLFCSTSFAFHPTRKQHSLFVQTIAIYKYLAVSFSLGHKRGNWVIRCSRLTSLRDRFY